MNVELTRKQLYLLLEALSDAEVHKLVQIRELEKIWGVPKILFQEVPGKPLQVILPDPESKEVKLYKSWFTPIDSKRIAYGAVRKVLVTALRRTQ